MDTYRVQYSYYPDGTGTDIVPLAAIYSGSNYLYRKNFGPVTIVNTAAWRLPFGSNLNVTDASKLSFQLGGDCGTAFCGGVYGYESLSSVNIDFSRSAYRRGVVMFGPRSFYTGPESGLPQVVAMFANYADGPHTASEVQIGGTINSAAHFTFTNPLSSNLYGVYGFNRSQNSGNAYGGGIIRSYSMTTAGFNYNCYSPSGQVNFSNGNINVVVVQ